MNFIKKDFRIYTKDSEGKILAEITYEKINEDTYSINHTFVDESLRGQGIANKLVEEAVKEIRSKNGKVVATCSYAKKWLEKSKEE